MGLAWVSGCLAASLLLVFSASACALGRRRRKLTKEEDIELGAPGNARTPRPTWSDKARSPTVPPSGAGASPQTAHLNRMSDTNVTDIGRTHANAENPNASGDQANLSARAPAEPPGPGQALWTNAERTGGQAVTAPGAEWTEKPQQPAAAAQEGAPPPTSADDGRTGSAAASGPPPAAEPTAAEPTAAASTAAAAGPASRSLPATLAADSQAPGVSRPAFRSLGTTPSAALQALNSRYGGSRPQQSAASRSRTSTLSNAYYHKRQFQDQDQPIEYDIPAGHRHFRMQFTDQDWDAYVNSVQSIQLPAPSSIPSARPLLAAQGSPHPSGGQPSSSSGCSSGSAHLPPGPSSQGSPAAHVGNTPSVPGCPALGTKHITPEEALARLNAGTAGGGRSRTSRRGARTARREGGAAGIGATAKIPVSSAMLPPALTSRGGGGLRGSLAAVAGVREQQQEQQQRQEDQRVFSVENMLLLHQQNVSAQGTSDCGASSSDAAAAESQAGSGPGTRAAGGSSSPLLSAAAGQDRSTCPQPGQLPAGTPLLAGSTGPEGARSQASSQPQALVPPSSLDESVARGYGIGERVDGHVRLDMELEQLAVGQVVGQGGFGRVHAGSYEGQPVAVKMVLGAGSVPAELAALRLEVSILSRVDHPNVLRLLGGNLRPPNPFIVSELLMCSLHDYIYHPQADTSVPVVVRLARDIAAGLAYLHPHVLHRDLKPGNVLLSEAGVPKISDFGLARWKLKTLLSTLSLEAGSVPYLAPECFDPDNWHLSDRLDVYSFAVILCEMLTRRPPWHGASPMQVAYQVHVECRRPDLPPPGAGVPAELLQLIGRCWRQNPRERPSAIQVHAELSALCDRMQQQGQQQGQAGEQFQMQVQGGQRPQVNQGQQLGKVGEQGERRPQREQRQQEQDQQRGQQGEQEQQGGQGQQEQQGPQGQQAAQR